MTSILIVGCGDVGTEIARQLSLVGHRVAGVRRNAKPLPDGVTRILADVTNPETLTQLATFHPDILIYCVAADAHNDESYRKHYVDGLRNTLNALSDVPLKHVFFISSTGVYGQQVDQWLNEHSPAIPEDFSGQRMLEAEVLLNDYPATILRFSGIYGPGRLRMIDLAKNPEHWPQRNGWTNRIHRNDGASFVVFLIEKLLLQNQSLENCYIVTDNEPVPLYELLLWLAAQQDIDAKSQSVPAVGGNKRLSNQRMLNTGFKFTYPDYRVGYKTLLN